MKKLINLALIIFTAGALVVATFKFNRLLASAKTNDAETAAVLKKNAAMQAQLDSLQQAPAQQADAGADETATAHATAKPAPKGADIMHVRIGSVQMQSFDTSRKREAERMKNDPDLTLKRYASLRADVDRQLAPFCRVRQLSKEQSEALAEAEFKRQLSIEDTHAAWLLGETGADALRVARMDTDDAFASSAKATLGDDLYEQFLVFQRQDGAWKFVDAYGGSMSMVDMPLSVEQAAQLADAIANASADFQQGKTVSFSLGKVDWNAVDAAAADILTPEQMSYFKNLGGYNSPGAPTAPRQSWQFNNALRKLRQ